MFSFLNSALAEFNIMTKITLYQILHHQLIKHINFFIIECLKTGSWAFMYTAYNYPLQFLPINFYSQHFSSAIDMVSTYLHFK